MECALCILHVLGRATAAEEWLSCSAGHNTLPSAAARQGVDVGAYQVLAERGLTTEQHCLSTSEREQWPAVPLQMIITSARA